MDQPIAPAPEDGAAADLAERLQWLLRLRWLIVPVFVAIDLAHDLLGSSHPPWTSLVVGAVLLAANAAYSALLARPHALTTLVRWARLEAAFVTAIPVAVVLLHGDPTNAVRYAVLVGVVGAAAALPRTSEIAVVAMWAVVALILADAVSAGFDPARLGEATVVRWATETGIIVTVAVLAGYLHSARESTARRLRAAGEHLERVRGEWEAAFDDLHELVFVTDGEGRVVRGNRAFAKVLGVRPHELAGRRLPELLAGHPERWWTLQGDGVREIDDPLLETSFEVTSTRLGDRVVHVARDVGEPRRLSARLVQADKLAAIGVLASGVAHEINNPTAFVGSNLAELKRYLAAYEAALAELSGLALEAGLGERVRAVLARSDVAFARREAAGAIAESQQGMERVRQIVANLRSLARRDPVGEPATPVELGEVVQAVVRTAASELRSASARVDVRGPVCVLGHRGELVDVVLNLVVNAVQSREEGRPNRVAVELHREGASAVLRVSDTGRGIAPASLRRLFEPFFATPASGEGTGQGLSLARRIVVAHGGALDVASELGVGSTFTVRLPALDAEEPAAPARREAG